MRLLHTAAAALGCLPTALSLMEFRRPPAFTGLVDPSRNPVRVIGTTLDLEWTPSQEGKKLSVVLYQLNATRAASFEGQFHFTEGPFEFITHDQVGATTFSWIVGTTKDLAISPMFAIAVWEEGAQVTDSATNIFNITRTETEPSTRSTASTATSTSSTSSPVSSPSSSDPPSTATTSDSTSTPPAAAANPATAGLSTGGAVGVGIGAAFAVVFLVGVGWYCGRRRAIRRNDVRSGMVEGAALPDKYFYAGTPPASELDHKARVYEAADERRYELS